MRRGYSFGVLAALLAMIAFSVGVFVGQIRTRPATADLGVPTTDISPVLVQRDAKPPASVKDLDFSRFWEIWQTVKERYVKDAPTDSQMFYGAIQGMVGSLKDPYSVFLDPDLARRFDQDLSGKFEGIGAEIGIRDDQVTVIAPLPETPAFKAGLKAGDKILEIDGTDTFGMLLEEAVSRIRGPRGTVVKLTVGRDGLKQTKELTIVRATIVIEPVKWKIVTKGGKRVAVVTMTQFNDMTAPKFAEAARSIMLENPAGLILDLRNNPGGYLESAVEVAGQWAPRQVIVLEKFSDGKEQKYTAPDDGLLVDVPTVVLANGGSASAAEIVAGALKDYGKAVVVGTQTYGKGSVQDYMSYDDDSALKLTVALWYTPKGATIDKQGIKPDIEVTMTPEDINKDLDPQLDKALEVILNPAASVVPTPTATSGSQPTAKE